MFLNRLDACKYCFPATLTLLQERKLILTCKYCRYFPSWSYLVTCTHVASGLLFGVRDLSLSDLCDFSKCFCNSKDVRDLSIMDSSGPVLRSPVPMLSLCSVVLIRKFRVLALVVYAVV